MSELGCGMPSPAANCSKRGAMDLGLPKQLSVATSIVKRLPWTKKRPSPLLLVEICKIFHNENKYVKCNEFSSLSQKTIPIAWNSSVEPQPSSMAVHSLTIRNQQVHGRTQASACTYYHDGKIMLASETVKPMKSSTYSINERILQVQTDNWDPTGILFFQVEQVSTGL